MGETDNNYSVECVMGKGQVTRDQIGRTSQSGKANALMVTISLGFLILAVSNPRFAAHGQNYSQSSSVSTVVLPTVNVNNFPVIVRPPIVVPVDVTNTQITNPGALHIHHIPGQNAASQVQAAQTSMALAGIQMISDKLFPGQEKVGSNFDWITVLAREGAVFTKPNNYTADLKQGEVIVSVKSPSRLAFVNTPYGDIAVGANSDVMVTFNQGVLRILNFDGEGRVLKVRLDKGPFGGPADPTVTIAPGYELIASDKIITRAEMRPKDGIARRYGKTLEKGHLAISEFSLTSAAQSVGMLVNLQQTTTGIKERRIMTDLSKMAAVLNYRSGETGYTVEK